MNDDKGDYEMTDTRCNWEWVSMQALSSGRQQLGGMRLEATSAQFAESRLRTMKPEGVCRGREKA